MSLSRNEKVFFDHLNKATAEIQHLSDKARNCSKCHLRCESDEPLVGAGYPLADIFLLKDYPNIEELGKGVAFAGKVGDAFYKAFEKLSLDISLVYGTNALKCRVLNKGFGEKEIAKCAEFLKLEIAIVKPRVILSMGETAASMLNVLSLEFDGELSFVPSRIYKWKPSIDVIITHSPELALSCDEFKKDFWRDLQRLKNYPT